jgi:hypothetical protein
VVAGLVVAACVLAPLATSAVWLRYQVLDTASYVKTVTPLSSSPAIDRAVASQVTAALFAHVDVDAEAQHVLPKQGKFLALPLSAGLRDYTQTAVEKFLATKQFRRLWQIANREAHEALVAALEGKASPLIAADGSVDIRLTNIVLAARQALAEAGLHLFDKVKPKLLQRRFVIAKPHSLTELRRAVTVLKAVSIMLPVLSALCLLLAFALSRERRRTVLWTGVGLAAAGAAAIVAVVALRTYYLHAVVGANVPGDAAGALYDVVFRNLRLYFKIGCLLGLAAAAAAVLAGPTPAAVRTRTWALRLAGRLADEAVGESVTVRWVAQNRSGIRSVAVVLALLLLLSAGHPTVRLLVKLAIGVAVVFAAVEILSRPAAPRRKRD